MLHNDIISRPAVASIEDQLAAISALISVARGSQDPARHYHVAIHRCDLAFGSHRQTHGDALRRIYFQIYYHLSEILLENGSIEAALQALRSAIDYRNPLTTQVDKEEEIVAQRKLVSLFKLHKTQAEVFVEQENLLKLMENFKQQFALGALHLSNAYYELAIDYLKQQEYTLTVCGQADAKRITRALDLLAQCNSASTEPALLLAIFHVQNEKDFFPANFVDSQIQPHLATPVIQAFKFNLVKDFIHANNLIQPNRDKAIAWAKEIGVDLQANSIRELLTCINENNLEQFYHLIDIENYPINFQSLGFEIQASATCVLKDEFLFVLVSRGYEYSNQTLVNADLSEAAVINETLNSAAEIPLPVTALITEYMGIKLFVGNSNLFWNAHSKSASPQKRKRAEQDEDANKKTCNTAAAIEPVSILNTEDELTQELTPSQFL